MQWDMDVSKLMKDNDEFAYVYVTEAEGPIRKKVEVGEVIRDGNLDEGSVVDQNGGCVDVTTDGLEISGGKAGVVVNGR